MCFLHIVEAGTNMIPLAILMDMIAEHSSATARKKITIASVSWVYACEGEMPYGSENADGLPAWAGSNEGPVAISCDQTDGVFESTSDNILVLLLCEKMGDISDSSLRENVLAVETSLSKLAFTQRLQKSFLDLMKWEQQLDQITIRDGSLQEFMDASEDAIGNFINISDSSFRVIAYTKGIPIDDPVTAQLIKRGYHDAEAISSFKKSHAMARWKRQQKSKYHEATDEKKYPFVNYVFRVNNTYFMQMIMTCNKVPFTQGLAARFDLLAKHMQKHIHRFEAVEEQTFEHASSFLHEVLSGKLVDDRFLEQQAKRLKIPTTNPARLYNLEPYEESEATVMWVARRISAELPECYVLPSKNNIYVIAFGHRSNPWSGDARIETALNLIATNQGYSLAASGIASSLKKLPLAREQVKAARMAGKRVSWTHSRPAIYHFELNVLPCILEGAISSSEAIRETANESLYGFLRRRCDPEDIENPNNNNAAFLLEYYLNHCGIADTARLLKIHRNTAANRIRSLEEEFDIDLRNPFLEESLRTCARILGD